MFRRIRSFLRNSGGNVAVTGTLAMLPLMAAVGAAVDYSRYSNIRNDVQGSIDAANLATGQEIAAGEDNREVLEAYSKEFFKANLPAHINPDDIVYNFDFVPGDSSVEPPTPDEVKITADIEYETLFGDAVGLGTVSEQLVSVITLGNRTVEIALVLDNSGSMSGNKINSLKEEAGDLIDIIFGSASLTTLPDPVKFSLVPFAGSVNVGTDNDRANWMDFRGWGPSHHENFDWDNTYRTNNNTRVRKRQGKTFGFQERVDGRWQWRTRFDVFEMLGTEWAGCVEMRPWPHNVLDTYVSTRQSYGNVLNSMDADGDGVNDGSSALFVPYFAPDEPDPYFPREAGDNDNLSPVAPNADHDWDDDFYRNDYVYDFQDYDQNNPVAYPNDRDQLYVAQNQNGNGLPHGNPAFGVNGSQSQIERTNWMFKYQRNAQYRGSLNQWRGPNYGCTTPPITPLTDDQDGILESIENMVANGTTNIQQGLTWGWRTLSSTEPFDEGREYGHRQNMKFIVLLSDGANFYNTDGDSTPNQTAYGAWGYARAENDGPKNALTGEPTHNRWVKGLDSSDLEGTIYENTNFDTTPESFGDFERIMNAHTLQACNNAKNAGVSIFTIAFDVGNNGAVRQLLQACAGSGIQDGEEVIASSDFYFDVDEGGLREAFQAIARRISNLRISG